jgi:hypothetical protein
VSITNNKILFLHSKEFLLSLKACLILIQRLWLRAIPIKLLQNWCKASLKQPISRLIQKIWSRASNNRMKWWKTSSLLMKDSTLISQQPKNSFNKTYKCVNKLTLLWVSSQSWMRHWIRLSTNMHTSRVLVMVSSSTITLYKSKSLMLTRPPNLKTSSISANWWVRLSWNLLKKEMKIYSFTD